MTPRPNILLITCDQLQAFATGCYGNPDVKTPHIDALASRGVRFEYGLSNAPVCMAARSVMLSGQFNRTATGGEANVSYGGGKPGSYPMPEYPGPSRLHFPNTTVPECLKSAGYTTAAIGKWHVYAWPDQIGFDHYVIPRTHHVHSAQLYCENGGPEFAAPGWSVEYETSRAQDYLTEQSGSDTPFFLYLNYSPPHPPVSDYPERYHKLYDPASITLRPNVDEENAFPADPSGTLDQHQARVYRWDYRYYDLQMPYTMRPMDYSIRHLTADYYGNVSWLDDQIGSVLATLRDTGLEEDTLVIFTSDHGDNLGSHGRSGKGLSYDESLRVPMIYAGPGCDACGVNVDTVAGLVDIGPTVLAAAGVDRPVHMPGTNVLRGGKKEGFCEIQPGTIALRSTQFTASAHWNPESEGWDRREFWDNESDPYQMTNLVGSDAFAEEQERMFSAIANYHIEHPILPRPDYGF